MAARAWLVAAAMAACGCWLAAAAPMRGDQAAILREVAAQLQPVNSSLLASWTADVDCNDWVGVQCDENGNIITLAVTPYNVTHPNGTVLVLSTIPAGDYGYAYGYEIDETQNFKNLLNGTISPRITLLTSLQILSFHGNSLTGTIPTNIGNLFNLKILDLGMNALKGEVPQSIANLTRLESLDLSENYAIENDVMVSALSGSIPLEIGNLVNLQLLDLHLCNFSGTVPPSLKSLAKLLILDLSMNSFIGPIDAFLGEFQNLQELTLSENAFSGGPFPAAAATYSQLQALSCSYCNLEGTIPATIFSMKGLTTLDLSSNNLTGLLPNVNGTLRLKSLILSSNRLNGSIPSSIWGISFLEQLFLDNNQFTGSLSVDAASPALIEVSLASNQLVGLIPSPLVSSIQIVSLNLSHNSFTELGAVTFGTTISLKILDLSFNALQSISSDVLLAGVLAELNLENNRLTGLPTVTDLVPTLKSLKLRNNRIKSLPDSYSNFTRLEILDLSNNRLTAVPRAIKQLTWLQELYLGSNNITNALPSFLGSFSFLQVLDVSNNPFTSTIPETFGADGVAYDTSLNFFKFISFRGLVDMNLSSCNLTAEIPSAFATLPRLRSLDLSKNFLNGTIPKFEATSLLSLDLSNNALSGSVPSSLGNLSLARLNLSNNQLFGYLPSEIFSNINLTKCDSYAGNPGLLISCNRGYVVSFASPPPPFSPPTAATSDKGVPEYVFIVASIMGVIFITMAVILVKYFRRPKKSNLTVKVEQHFVKAVRLQAIREATGNFDEGNLLGSGGYGNVYRGETKKGEVWAVKRAKTVSLQGLEIFQNEVDIISRMNHRNLVKLLGFCDEDNEQLLIYEFVPNGTLKAALRAKDGRPPLSFQQRLDIALGAAEGLRYLHTQAKPAIIHRDVKSENILLDAKMQAKVADFGLLKGNDEDRAESSITRVAGTHGYMDPEYYTTYRVTTKSDVYSFGVVLLELITGQPALVWDRDEDDDEQLTSLATWALHKMRTSLGLSALIDPKLEGEYRLESMQSLANIAASCLQRVGKYRPEMAEVSSELRRLKVQTSSVEGEGSGQPLLSKSIGDMSSSATSAMSRGLPEITWSSSYEPRSGTDDILSRVPKESRLIGR